MVGTDENGDSNVRVCPNCEFHDPEYWKQCAFRQHVCYCRLSDLELHRPKLAERLKREPYLSEGFYAYHLTRGKRVERQAICENPNWQTSWYVGKYERSKSNRLPSHLHVPSLLANKHIKNRRLQKKLFEVVE